MVVFTLAVWAVIASVACCAILGVLAATAHARAEECRLHDLKTRVHELRAAYQRRLAEMRRGQFDAPSPETEEAVLEV